MLEVMVSEGMNDIATLFSYTSSHNNEREDVDSCERFNASLIPGVAIGRL